MLIDIEKLTHDVRDIDELCDINFGYLQELIRERIGSEEEYQGLLTNWKAHLEWWMREYGTKDKKYLKDSHREQRKNIVDFIETDAWKRDWQNAYSYVRDSYLFPNVKAENLHGIIKQIKEQILAERDEHRAGKNTAPGS